MKRDPFFHQIIATLRLTLMAKHPTPGNVKTRLMPALSAEQAARVHETFFFHWLDRIEAIDAIIPQLYFDPPEMRGWFQAILTERWDGGLKPQTSGNLGERLMAATDDLATSLFRPFFIGVDSPDVPDATLIEAMSLVKSNTVVLGPAGDGGFWCLGMGAGVDAGRILVDIDWSSGREASQVIARAHEAGYHVRHAGMWDDVDRPDDLRKLMRRLKKGSSGLDRSLYRALNFLPRELQA